MKKVREYYEANYRPSVASSVQNSMRAAADSKNASDSVAHNDTGNSHPNWNRRLKRGTWKRNRAFSLVEQMSSKLNFEQQIRKSRNSEKKQFPGFLSCRFRVSLNFIFPNCRIELFCGLCHTCSFVFVPNARTLQ